VERCDVVVVGGGHNALTAAAYLQRAGLSTVVLEAADQLGGLAATTRPEAGYLHHPHANFLSYADVMPMAQDFPGAWKALQLLTPAVQHGIAFADGRPPIVIWKRGREAEIAASVGAYSRADAGRLTALLQASDQLTGSLKRAMFGGGDARGLRDHVSAVRAAYADQGVADALGSRTAAALIDGLFESEELRTLLYALCEEFGTAVDAVGSDLGFLGFVVWMLGRRSMPVGGMHTVVQVMAEAATAEGADLRSGVAVARILTDRGAASGVETTTGYRITSRAVISGADLGATMLDLLPADSLSAADARRLGAFTRARPASIASLFFALGEPPDYLSARHEPAINDCWQTFVGYDCPDDVRRHSSDVALGRFPAPAGAVRVNSLWDPTQAPPGRHAAGADCAFPDVRTLAPAEAGQLEAAFPAALLEVWSAAAPNLAGSTVMSSSFDLPPAHDRSVFMEWEGASTPLPGLFRCGPSSYPGGGVHGACGYNAARAVVRELAG
jgi:phytoene dehydrogenase-like protein